MSNSGSPPGSPIPGILPARTLGYVYAGPTSLLLSAYSLKNITLTKSFLSFITLEYFSQIKLTSYKTTVCFMSSFFVSPLPNLISKFPIHAHLSGPTIFYPYINTQCSLTLLGFLLGDVFHRLYLSSSLAISQIVPSYPVSAGLNFFSTSAVHLFLLQMLGSRPQH